MTSIKSVLPLDKTRRNTHTKKTSFTICKRGFLIEILFRYSFAPKELDKLALLAAFTIIKITHIVIKN